MPTEHDSFPPETHSGLTDDQDDKCAGCNAEGVQLLACDDLDGNGTADPALRARCVHAICNLSICS